MLRGALGGFGGHAPSPGGWQGLPVGDLLPDHGGVKGKQGRIAHRAGGFGVLERGYVSGSGSACAGQLGTQGLVSGVVLTARAGASGPPIRDPPKHVFVLN